MIKIIVIIAIVVVSIIKKFAKRAPIHNSSDDYGGGVDEPQFEPVYREPMYVTPRLEESCPKSSTIEHNVVATSENRAKKVEEIIEEIPHRSKKINLTKEEMKKAIIYSEVLKSKI